MSNENSSIQTECLNYILKNYPAAFFLTLLNKMSIPISSKKDIDSPDLALKKSWRKLGLAEKAMDFFDDYACNGRVHIFFYNLCENKYFPQLRYVENLRRILPEEYRSLINRKIFVWDSKNPKLVEIRHRFNKGSGDLIFKWVETRFWDERVSGSTAQSPPQYVRRKERSVNYFIIDLGKGTAQIRIQLIKPNALKSLKMEHEIYQKEIKKLVDFNIFRRIELESVVRKMLMDKKINPKSWEIWLPSGGCFIAKGRLKLYVKVGFNINITRFLDFFSRKLLFEWCLENEGWGPLYVKLKVDGEKDVLTIYSPCDQKQIISILNRAMSIRKNKVKNKDLKKFVKNKPCLERIVLSFDYHLNRLKRKKVIAGHLIDGEWLQENKVVTAIESLCENFPKNYYYKGIGKNLTLIRISKKR